MPDQSPPTRPPEANPGPSEGARVSEDQLRLWERLAAEATPGPWYWWMSESPPFKLGNEAKVGIGIAAGTIMDAQFLCAAREAVPVLAGEVRALRSRTDAFTEVAGQYRAEIDRALAGEPEAEGTPPGEACYLMSYERVERCIGRLRQEREVLQAALRHYRDQCPTCGGTGEVVWLGEETGRAPGPCPRCRVAREGLGEEPDGGG